MPILLLTVPVVSTLIGGLLAIRLRQYISLLMAVGAGLLLGAAFLDLLPEAVELGVQSGIAMIDVLALTLACFLLFLCIDVAIAKLLRHRRWSTANQRAFGRTGAAMLIFHSFRDGMAIGAAYATSHPAGYAVALGIAAHDLGDGMNTVLLTTGGRAPTRIDALFLLADAVAPLLGGILTSWWVVSSRGSVLLRTLAAGFFLQMATGEFLPEIRRRGELRGYVLPSVLLGSLLIYAANALIAQYR